jgi:hypothetical protein
MTPQARALWRRKFFAKKKFGANVGNGASVVVDWDADTTGQPPSNLVNDLGVGASADGGTVVADSIEGHTKVLELAKYADGYDRGLYDLGVAYDYSDGIKIQVLCETTDITKFNMQLIFQKVATQWSGTDQIYCNYQQGNNPDTFRGAVYWDGVNTHDTGDDSTAYDGTSSGWHYVRWHFRKNNTFIGNFHTIAGANADGSPFTSTWDTQPSEFPNNLRYFGFTASDNWYGNRIAEIWIAPDSTAWPTAGEPQG